MTRFAAALVAAAIVLPAAAQSPGGTLAKIRDSKTITLGYRETAVPFSFTGEGKQPDGKGWAERPPIAQYTGNNPALYRHLQPLRNSRG